MGFVPGDGENSFQEVKVIKNRKKKTSAHDQHEAKYHRVRLPGFVSDKDIGLGDVIKRATYAIGVKPCGGCERRATTLNRWMVFSGKGGT